VPATIDPANAVIVLSLLEEEPRSGYDIKRVVDERLEELVTLTAGTVYYTLKRLEARGWAKSASAGRTRRVYRITADGRRGFLALLEELSLQPIRLFGAFEMALYFAPRLSPDALARSLDRQIDELGRNRERLGQLEERWPGRWPFHYYYLREKTRELVDANERWLKRMQRKIQERSLVSRPSSLVGTAGNERRETRD
jgi:DNA-binding PadR family transcriptional regulator